MFSQKNNIGNLAAGPTDCIKYMSNPGGYISKTVKEESKPGMLRAKLEILHKLSKSFNGGKYENLVELARNMF